MSELYQQMDEANAALCIEASDDLAAAIYDLITFPEKKLHALQKNGYEFAKVKASVLETILEELEPVFLQAHLPPPKVVS